MTTDFERWLITNDQYLAESLAWLRGRLALLSTEDLTPAAQRPTSTEARPASRSLLDRVLKPVPPATPERGLKSGSDAIHGESGRPPAALIKAESVDHPPALVVLGNRLGLSAFERNVLLLCASVELDTRIAGMCARAQRDINKTYPTFALALTLFDEPTWSLMSPERPLRYWRLIEINQPGAQPLTVSALRADERIVNYIKGLNYVDDRITPMLTPLGRAGDGQDLPPSQLRVALAIADGIEHAAASETVPAVQLLGADGVSKRMVAQRVATELGLQLYRVSAEAIPTAVSDLETLARLWQRERMLLPIGLYVAAADTDRNDAAASAIRRWVNRDGGPVFLDVREPWPGIERATMTVDVAKPTSVEQRDTWFAALESEADDDPSKLAAHFSFNVPTIRHIAREARAQASGERGELSPLLWNASLMQARPALDQLAQRLEPKATWHDIKLPQQDEELLRQIADQVGRRGTVYDTFGFRERMNRGLGISALFAGDSGTGKTMAAEVLANDLGLLLYRIDLSAVVSKYIGETEKNLRKLFDAAEDGGAILFFDEADALFGKRSEVKDSHDRYANIETNYLLQRMEAYGGLAILATNMKSSLDSAFMRRLRFVITFPFPGQVERKAMWQGVFPADTPLGDLDYDKLARLNLTGGSIQNIALNSAFRTARAGGAVTMPLVLDAARDEFRKLEKPINEMDFRWLEVAGGGKS